MAARIIETRGSGDFTAGAGSIDGKGAAVVLDAAHQDEAYALALAFFPMWVGGIPRGSINTTDQGGGVFVIDVQYRNAVPTENAPTAGNSPGDARPPGDTSGTGGANNTDHITRDVTFSTGGATKRILKSIKTRLKLAKAGDTAPDFGKLIGVQKDGKVEGCEVIAAQADFTITKRFQSLTLGWFRRMLDLIACTNKAVWLGMAAGEVLFKGCDGNFKDGDQFPWTVTGKFGYSRNFDRTESPEIAEMLTVGEIQIPNIRGWEYLWISYNPKVTEEEIMHNGQLLKVPIEYPRWAYVEQVYHEGNLTDLRLDDAATRRIEPDRTVESDQQRE